MSHPLDHQANRATRVEDQRKAKQREAMFRADVQTVMASKSARRVLWAFLQDVGVDSSPFSQNGLAMAHATGLQDGGKWWLNVLRAHCPELEATMRAEARKPEVIERDPEAESE